MKLISIVPRDNSFNIPFQSTRRDSLPGDPEGFYKAYRYSLQDTGQASIKILPYKDTARTLQEKDIDYSAPIQPLVYEFDQGGLDEQKQFISNVTQAINTPAYAVFSGNKSYHSWIWLKHFADNETEYKRAWKGLFKYFIDLGLVPDGLTPDEKLSNPTIYSRTPGAYNDGSLKKGIPGRSAYQETIDFNGIEYIADLSNYVSNIKDSSRGPDPVTRKNTEKPRLNLKELIQRETGQKFLKNNLDPCPICGHNDCFKYDPKMKIWKCFSSNHMGINSGYEIQFIQAFLKINKIDAILYLKQNYIIPDRNYYQRIRAISKRLKNKSLKPFLHELLIHYYNEGSGIITPDYKKIMFEFGISRNTVKSRLKFLEDSGFLLKMDNKHYVILHGTDNPIREGTTIE